MDGKHTAQAIGFFVERMKFRMAERTRHAVGRKSTTDHAVFFYNATELSRRGFDVLKRQHGDALQSCFVAQEPVMEVIVVGARKVHCKFGDADLADMHETRGIKDCGLEVPLIQRELPIS